MTLIEIIFAFAIITSVLTLAYASALTAWRNAVEANQRTQAQSLVQYALETVRAARESDGFVWKDFVDKTTKDSSGFHIRLVNTMGNPTPEDLVCPVGESCTFEVMSGSSSKQVTGANAPDLDATVFIVKVEVDGGNIQGNTSYYDRIGLNTNVVNVSSLNIVATVTWTGPTGISNNARASTIISRPQ